MKRGSSTRSLIVAYLARHGSGTAAGMSKDIGRDRSGVTEVLSRMARDGEIAATLAPRAGRGRWPLRWSLTEATWPTQQDPPRERVGIVRAAIDGLSILERAWNRL